MNDEDGLSEGQEELIRKLWEILKEKKEEDLTEGQKRLIERLWKKFNRIRFI